MEVETLRAALGWSALINLILLFLWGQLFIHGHDFVHRMHTRWFKLPEESFDSVHYVIIIFYKVVVWAFLVVPWIALHIIA